MTLPIIVQKYGGSSVATVENIQQVARLIQRRRDEGFRLCVIVSAMGKTTDTLLQQAKSVSQEPPRRELDMLLSCGERITMSLLAMALHEIGVPSISFTGSQSGIITDDRHTGARIIEVRPYRVQDELERMVLEEGRAGIALCDRGTVDGLAYWPAESSEPLWGSVGTTHEVELRRNHAVIHLRTPVAGYNHLNPLRTESAAEALRVDQRIEQVWQGHPRRFFIESADDFLVKVARAVELIRAEFPDCCRAHPVGLESLRSS